MLRWMWRGRQTASAPEATEAGAARQDDWEYLRNRPDFDPEEMASVRRRPFSSAEAADNRGAVWKPSEGSFVPTVNPGIENEPVTPPPSSGALSGEDLEIGQLLNAALGQESEMPGTASPDFQPAGADRPANDLLEALLMQGREVGLLDELDADSARTVVGKPTAVGNETWRPRRR